MKKLVLHIGMAKTGTSSIQDSLGNASASLQDAGVIYPPEQPFNHSYTFSVIFKTSPRDSIYFKRLGALSDEEVQAEIDRLKQGWTRLFESRPEGTFIVSAESLSGMTRTEVEKVREFTSRFFDRVQVLVYVRHPTTAIRSQWEQNVKSLDRDLTPRELLALTKRRYNYNFLSSWISAFGSDNITVRPFDRRAFRNGELIDDFLYSAGVADLADTPLSPRESNQSLGREGAAFLMEFNKRYPKFADDSPNEARGLARRQNLFYHILREVPAKPLDMEICFNSEEAEAINEQIRQVNRFIAAEHRFAEVIASEEETDLPDAGEISTDYYVELINAFARKVGSLSDGAEHLQRLLERERQKNLESNTDDGVV